MEDSRVPLQLQNLQVGIAEEIDWLASLSTDVWQQLAEISCAGSMGELRSKTLAAGHVSIAFLTQRLLLSASKPPWSIATGDVGEELEWSSGRP